MSRPQWMSKHPCTSCGEGYGACAQFLSMSLKCCRNCDHPGRWVDEPYTAGEVLDMWEGREIPEDVKRWLNERGVSVVDH